MRRRQRVRAAIVLALAMTGVPARAQEPSAAQVVVTAAAPDPSGNILAITGQNFGTNPFVTLDLLPLIAQEASDTHINLVLPVKMPAGTYLLTVSRGPSPTESGSLDFTLGGAEPKGDTSNKGDPRRPAVAPASSTSNGDAAAKVGDRTITLADVDGEWRRTEPATHASLNRQMYEIRRRIVEKLAGDELLAQEAAARGLTTEELLKEEIAKRPFTVPEVAVETLYQRLGNTAQGATLEQMRPALRAWLNRRTAPEIAKLNYLNELTRTSTAVRILLEPPRVEVERTSQDAILGSPTALVEIVAFGDFRSPEYARIAQAFTKVREIFGDRVRFVFKNLPASGDQGTITAAEAAQCAKAQGQFWAYHDALLTQQGSFDLSRLKQHATNVGLNRDAFDRCADEGEFRALIQQAIQEAGRYGIESSPSFLINGRLAPASPPFLPPFEFFKRLIEEELLFQAKSPSPVR